MTDNNKAPSLRLSPVKEKAAYIIANGGTQVTAADKCGKSKQTLTKWCKDPKFLSRIDELRADFSQQADEILQEGVVDAALTVIAVIKGRLTVIVGKDEDEEDIVAPADNTTLNTRLKAALWILDRHKKGKLPSRSRPKDTEDAAAEAEFTSDEEADDMLDRGIPEDE